MYRNIRTLLKAPKTTCAIILAYLIPVIVIDCLFS